MPDIGEPGRDRDDRKASKTMKAIAAVLREEFGVAFRLYDAEEGGPVGPAGEDDAASIEPVAARPEVAEVARAGQAEVAVLPGGAFEIRLPFADQGFAPIVAVGVLPSLAQG